MCGTETFSQSIPTRQDNFAQSTLKDKRQVPIYKATVIGTGGNQKLLFTKVQDASIANTDKYRQDNKTLKAITGQTNNLGPIEQCSGTPNGGSASIYPDSGPTGTDANLSVINYDSGLDGLSYDWQYSVDDGATWYGTGIPDDDCFIDMYWQYQDLVISWRYAVYCSWVDEYGYSDEVTFTIDNSNCIPPEPTGCNGDNIASVALLTLNDQGLTCTPYYEDRTGVTIPDLQRTKTIPMSV